MAVEVSSSSADGSRQQQESRQRQETRHAARRQAILDAAAAEFAETGYERATLERIGDRVGLTKTSLYYYVNGKEQLLTQLLEQVVTDIEQRAAALAGTSSSPITRLHAFAAAHLAVGTSRPAGKILAENFPPLLADPSAADLLHRHEQSIAAILEDGIAAQIFKQVPVAPLVKLLLGALNAVPRWFDPEGPLPLEDLTRLAVDSFLSGVLEDKT